MDKVVQDTLKNLDESIEQLNKKKEMTPSDLETLCKAYKLKMELEGCYMNGGYSEGGMMRGSYGSYGYNHYDRMPMDHSMGDWHAEGSFAPMRSPVTGRYVSRDGMGMSSHSVKDRMIARLEGMYDEAKGEYEREEIRKEIRNIEANK